jgi:hypothetical protein
MSIRKEIISLLIILTVCFNGFSQVQTKPTPEATTKTTKAKEKSATKKAELSPELKQNTLGLLQETIQLAGNFNSIENRVNYTVKASEMLWTDDEKQARISFQSAISDFLNYAGETDTEFVKIEALQTNDQNQTSQNTSLISESFSMNKVIGFYMKPSRISRLRMTIISSLSTTDPVWAYNFLIQTQQMFMSKMLADAVTSNDKYLENSLLGQIANKDVDLALELARKKLAQGFSPDLISVFAKVYQKDAAKGSTFGEELVSKLQGMKADVSVGSSALSLLRMGSSSLDTITRTKSDKKPMLSSNALRNLADIIATSDYISTSEEIFALIEKYSPSSAAKIRQKTGIKSGIEPKVYTVASASSGSGRGSGSGSSNDPSRFWNSINKLTSQNFQKLSDFGKTVSSLTNKDKTDEEVLKSIEEKHQEVIAMENPDFRFAGLLVLAAQTARLEKKDLAEQYLDEARNLLNGNLKNQKDFSDNFSLANAYANVNSDKSFTILENAVFQLNDIISATIKMGEYTGGGVVEDGELQMSANQYSLRFFNVSTETLKKLAEIDFERTKGLTEKFDRLEMRAESKLMIARALLNPPQNGLQYGGFGGGFGSPPPPTPRPTPAPIRRP